MIDDFDNTKDYEIFDSMGKKVTIIKSRKTDITLLEKRNLFCEIKWK